MTETQKKAALKMLNAGVDIAEIAADFGVPVTTLKSFYMRGGEQDAVVKPETGNCKWCGPEFKYPHHGREKRFCCRHCYNQWWHAVHDGRKAYRRTCPTCGKGFTVYGNKRQKYCSVGCFQASRKAGGERE